MAQKQKRPSPLDEPPTASSSDSEEEETQQPSSLRHGEEEEEEASSGEEEEESSGEEAEDDDLPPPINKTNPPPPSTNPHPQPSSSDSETASESETESETESTPAKAVKPLASKPMDQAQKPKALPSPAPPKPPLKRAAENINSHIAKKKKKSGDSSSSAAASDEEMEDGKKSGDQMKKSQRLWSEDDEIAILKGLADFTSKTGHDPLKFEGGNAFHAFLKKSLHVEVTSNQLKEKARRLKKKYETAAVRGNGADGLTFSKPHDQKTFELSRKVWGSELDGAVANGAVEKPKANGNATKSPKKKETGSRNVASAKKAKPEPKQEVVPGPRSELKESEKTQINQKPVSCEVSMFLHAVSRFKEGLGVFGLDEGDVMRGLELIGESKRAELRAKWKKLQRTELELFANRSELIGEQTKLIVEALRSSNH
ncbi:hypothetical protein VNO80_28557 [Phaseolus coccineus]|uniref:Glabrous enhancer-binding protein-like DBD domain-containing protein n=1 Tax=Phaseolus coccineus TaxID=3886 RepID=A0AAN9L9T7_PHACN